MMVNQRWALSGEIGLVSSGTTKASLDPAHESVERLILLVDDREHTREFVSEELALLGHRVIEAQDGVDGWEKFCAHQVDLVISDLRMPKSDGLELLGRIRSSASPNPQVPVLLLSAYGTLAVATDAGRAGATAFYGYNDSGIEDLLDKTKELLAGPSEPPPELLGATESTIELRSMLESHAPICAPICLCGELGIDFESIARFIHGLSRQSNAPFQSRSATFVGAVDPSFSGTVFLQDVHSLPRDEQLIWRDKMRSSGTMVGKISSRIIASLPGRPRSLVAEGSLIPELASVLERFCLDVAPLRERVIDVPQISEALVLRIEKHYGRNGFRLSTDAKKVLSSHNWYENIDELTRVLEAVIVSARGLEISGDQIRAALSRLHSPLDRIALEERRKERTRLIELWAKHLTYTGVAEELGVTRNTAKYRMAKHNLIPGRAGLPTAGDSEPGRRT